jgi:hypothetical protein
MAVVSTQIIVTFRVGAARFIYTILATIAVNSEGFLHPLNAQDLKGQ